jgi:hypothetical protein
VNNIVGGRLPEPIANLIMISFYLIRLGDVGVISQSIKQLRPIGLWINWLELDAFDIGLLARPISLGFDVKASLTLPDSGHSGKWAKVAQGVYRVTLWFGKNVGGKIIHDWFCKKGIYDKFLVIIKLPQTLLENCMISRIARFSLISLVSATIGLTPMAVFAADPAPAPAPAAAPVSAPVAAPTPAEPSSTKAAEKKAKKQSKKQKKAEKKAKKKSKKKAQAAADAAVQ